MIIPVEVESKDYFKTYITCLNPILKLRPREIEVLTVLIKSYFQLEEFANQGHFKHTEIYNRMHGDVGRKILSDSIKMSTASFTNHIVKLKQKKVITADLKLPDYLINIPKRGDKIVYDLIIKDGKN